MSKITFTNAQMEIIRANPFTVSVTEHRINYSLEFKRFALRESEAGLSSTKIFKKAGYDPEILGHNRMAGAIRQFKKEAASPKGLRPPRGEKKTDKFAQETLSKKRNETAIKQLQERVILLEQELDFLKKMARLEQELDPKK